MREKSDNSELYWEQLNSSREGSGFFTMNWEVHRAKVFGGWLVLVRESGVHNQSLTFYPDPEHKWDGGSLT